MSVKILEKRKTATERIVVYEVGGERKTIGRPSFVSFDEIIEEVERRESEAAAKTTKIVERKTQTSGAAAVETTSEENVSAVKSVSKKTNGKKTEIKIEE